MKTSTRGVLAALVASALASGCAGVAPATGAAGNGPKPATPTTERANQAVSRSLALNDPRDFEDATRGLIATLVIGSWPQF
ncbi:hypothetical protein AB4Z46_30765 [Variovorax sp. M-6]|uniref:hypothetical protein n=1 Tax=Variovorax sp. M-6 TaxID=3233041 RepID=UPI003F9E85CD